MAKIRKIYDQTIKPDGTKTTIYPITSTRAVYTPQGESLDSIINSGDVIKNTALDGYKACEDVTSLPLEETKYGYLIGEDLYVWVGTGGDTLEGLYQNCGPFRGPKGDKGDQGEPTNVNAEDLEIKEGLLQLSDRTSEEGMNYVILRKDKTLIEQMPETLTDTIFEIRYNFDIGETVHTEVNEECSIGGNVYYHNAEPIALSNGESIAVNAGNYILNSTVDTVLSSGASYTANADTSVFVAALASGEAEYYTPTTLIVPARSVLKFNGGSLTNGTINFNYCAIEGPAKIFCDVSGTTVSTVDCRWFGAKAAIENFDNGPIINKAASTTNSSLYLGPGNYYFQTPIVISGKRNIDIKGSLMFNGNPKDTSFVTIYNCQFAKIEILRVFVSTALVNYKTLTESFSNCVGVDLINCNSCDIHIGRIFGANTAFRFFGDGDGCSYNTLHGGDMGYFNYGVHFYQAHLGDSFDGGKGQGWCNENTLQGIRFTKFSDFDTEWDVLYPIYMCGPKNSTDTYDRINSISINECSAENFGAWPAIYMRNAQYINVNRLRCEGTNKVAKFVGSCLFCNFIDAGYSYNGRILNRSSFDLTEVTNFPFGSLSTIRRAEDSLKISSCRKTISSSTWAVVDGFTSYGLATDAFPSRQLKYRAGSVVGATITCSTTDSRFVILRSTTAGRVVFIPLEAVIDGVTYTWPDDESTLKTYKAYSGNSNTTYSYNASQHVFKCGGDITAETIYVPQPITKFFVGFTMSADTTVDLWVNNLLPENQTWATRSGSARPTNLGVNEVGFEFFDTTLNRPVWWTGAAWSDPLGA